MFPVSVMRKALQDLRFSDGTVVPSGTLIVAAAMSTHMDEENYPNAEVFDPWRFSNMREEEGEITKHQFVSTSVDYVSFGHGKHAWYILKCSICILKLMTCIALDVSSLPMN